VALAWPALLGSGLMLSQLPAFSAEQPGKPPAKEAQDFRVAALLHISYHPPRVLPEAPQVRTSHREFQVYRRTQAVLVKSHLVLGTALRNPKVAQLKLVQQREDPEEWLAENLRVDFPEDAEIMRIAVRGKPSEELATLVNAVTDAYLSEIVNKDQIKKLHRVDFLREMLSRQENNLRDKRKHLRVLTEQVGGQNPEAHTARQKANRELQARTRKELMNYKSQLRSLSMKLSAHESLQKAADKVTVPDNLVNQAIDRDPVVMRIRGKIAALEEQYETTKKDAQKKENDPAVKHILRQVEEERQALKKRQEKIKPDVLAELRKQAQEKAQAEMASTRDQIAFLRKYIEILEEDEKRLDEGDQNMNRGFLDLESFKNEITQVEAVAKRIGAEIQTMELELKAPARVTLVEYASAPAAK
jgi:hypothetical protein